VSRREIVGPMPVSKKILTWSTWVLANGAGVFIGTLAATALIPVVAFTIAAFGSPDAQPINIFFTTAVVASLFMGVSLGASQWLILRMSELSVNAPAWIAATTIGTFLVWTSALLPAARYAAAPTATPSAAPDPTDDPHVFVIALTLGALFGTIVGTAQWVVIRRRLEGAKWWILSSALAGAVALPLMVLALSRAESQTSYWDFWFMGAFSATALGAMCGGVTGFTLIEMRRRA
jgi:hypothetical protein